VGLIGLGAGTLAAYGASGDTFRFYEINPLVVDLARTEFTFLEESPARVEVIVADARLALEREEPEAFDLFIADAFSSDAVPTHLLTLEAFQLYLRHLGAGGALAVHVSNRYLDLAPVVAAAATSLGKDAFRIETPADPAAGVFAAEWVVVAEGESLARVPALARIGKPLDGRAAAVWTDDYSNLFGSLR
jgi:spermidine synthase